MEDAFHNSQTSFKATLQKMVGSTRDTGVCHTIWPAPLFCLLKVPLPWKINPTGTATPFSVAGQEKSWLYASFKWMDLLKVMLKLLLKIFFEKAVFNTYLAFNTVRIYLFVHSKKLPQDLNVGFLKGRYQQSEWSFTNLIKITEELVAL